MNKLDNIIKEVLKERSNKTLKEQKNYSKERFEEIIGEVKELIKEAYDIVPKDIKARAKAYWYGHIISNIDNDHGFLGRGGHTMQDTLDEWDGDKEDEDEEDEI